jgi:hypothetical protein
MNTSLRSIRFVCAGAALISVVLLNLTIVSRGEIKEPSFNDSHFHLTNYIQEGPQIAGFLRMMGSNVGRVALFGIPLQQQWSYRLDGDRKPTYYLHTDAPLYYYSFTDAWIAMAYRSLPAEQRARFDPMITGFNPADMYAADHIRRVLQTFPGVFSGIGEFTIHKEFVAAKVAGDAASLQDPALDRILDFAAEVGLVVLIHNDMDVPSPVRARRLHTSIRRRPCSSATLTPLSSGLIQASAAWFAQFEIMPHTLRKSCAIPRTAT